MGDGGSYVLAPVARFCIRLGLARLGNSPRAMVSDKNFLSDTIALGSNNLGVASKRYLQIARPPNLADKIGILHQAATATIPHAKCIAPRF